MSTASPTVQGLALRPAQMNIAAAAGVALAALIAAAALTQSIRMGLLALTGAALGLVLYHSVFGFTSAFRVLIANGRSAGIRAQMVMLGLACLLFFPVLAAGQIAGHPVGGFVAPAGVGVAAGAFIFGIGMQLGGACASGTLFTVGGGSVRMLVTLVFFIIGSVIGLEHLPFWEALPSLGAVSMITGFGWPLALVGNLAVFALVWQLVARMERRRHGRLEPITSRQNAQPDWRSFTRGPWPLLAGAVALALLNFATLYLAGRPWGITSAFALWGAKAFNALGADMANWASWSSPDQRAALAGPLLSDITSVMNFGIVLGALAGAALAGKFAPDFRIPARSLLAAIIGGLMLGYGARLAYGCNIGAFFSGIASGSLHGWMWIAFAMVGNWIGVGLRPAFGLAVERTPSAC